MVHLGLWKGVPREDSLDPGSELQQWGGGGGGGVTDWQAAKFSWGAFWCYGLMDAMHLKKLLFEWYGLMDAMHLRKRKELSKSIPLHSKRIIQIPCM